MSWLAYGRIDQHSDVRPIPNPMTNTVTDNKATSSDVLNVSTTPGIPGVMTADANATAKHIQLKVIVMTHFRTSEKFFGFSGSAGAKLTTLYVL